MKSCFLHKNLYFTGLLQSIRSRLKLRMQIKFFRFFKIIYYILQIIFSILHLQHSQYHSNGFRKGVLFGTGFRNIYLNF
jgi:hypothetical protein